MPPKQEFRFFIGGIKIEIIKNGTRDFFLAWLPMAVIPYPEFSS